MAADKRLHIDIDIEAERAKRALQETQQGLDKTAQKATDLGKAIAGTEQRFKSAADITRDFDKAIKDLESKVTAFERSQKTAAASVDKTNAGVMGLVGTVTRYVSGAAILAAVKSTADWASRLDDLSKQTGLTTTELQRLSFAAAQNGRDIGEVARAIGMMQVQLSSGDKGAVKMLERLGLTFDEIRKASPADQFTTIASAIGRVEDPALRAEAATAIFGRTGRELLPLLTADFKRLADQAPVTGESAVRALDDTGDAVDRLWATIQSRGASVLGWLVTVARTGPAPMVAAEERALAAVAGMTEAQVLEAARARAIAGRPNLAATVAARGIQPLEFLGGREAGHLESELATALRRINERQKEVADAAKKAAAESLAAYLSWRDGLREVNAELQRVRDLAGAGADALAGRMATPMGNFEVAGALNPFGVSPFRKGLLLGAGAQGGFGGELDFVPTKGLPFLPGTRIAPDPAPGAPGLLSGFGSLLQSGALTQTIMGSLMGGGSMGKSVGGLLGGQLFGNIAGKIAGSSIGKLAGGVLGSVLPGLGTIVGSLGGQLLGKLGGLFGKGEHGKVNDMRDQFISAAGGLDALNVKAVEAGTSLDRLLAAKKVKDFEAAVADLQGKIGTFASQTEADQLRLNAALDKYGISWEEAGRKFKQSQIDAMAKELVEDFRVLTQVGGVDAVRALEGMKDQVNAFIQSALRTGTEVPAAMKPMLQQLVDMGALVDENGLALKDLASIPFAETLTQGFDRLEAAINRVADVLQGLPGDAARAAGGVQGAFAGVSVNVPVKFDFPEPGGITGGRGGEYDVFHLGGKVLPFVPRAHNGLAIDEALIVAQRGERVLNRRETQAYERASQRGGDGSPVIVNLHIDRPIFQDERGIDDLVNKVERKLTHKLGNRIKLTA
jgi:hypothetical protein